MKKKRAIVVGSKGQDGRLLFVYLKKIGYSVLGLSREKSEATEARWARKRISILNSESVRKVVRDFEPDEIYHLAAFHYSSQDPRIAELELFRQSFDVNTMTTLYLLEAIRNECPKTHLFYAASSHVFGSPMGSPQDEQTPLDPENVYGISKATAIMMCRYYRKVHGVFASVGILYNHESELRPSRFVSKKITEGAVAIKQGAAKNIILGDLNAAIDWGYAPDYVRAMQQILSLRKSEDFVIATGKAHRVKDFVRLAFGRLGLSFEEYVKVDKRLVSRSKTTLVGNSNKLRRMTGWKPSQSFDAMVKILVDAEIKTQSREKK